LAQQNFGPRAHLLGAFVVAAGVAELISAPLWGRYADWSSKAVVFYAALITSGTGLAVFVVSRFFPLVSGTLWFLPVGYFVLSLAHSGVRVGRKTYVVNLATGNKRTDYVAVSNTLIGILLLIVGSIGALAPVMGNDGVIGLLAMMGLAGALYGRSLPEIDP
jgi:MFS family permease